MSMSADVLYRFVSVLQRTEWAVSMLREGQVAVFANTASVLYNGSAIDFAFACLCEPGHPGEQATKAKMKQAFSLCVFSVFPVHLECNGHLVLVVFNHVDKRLWLLDPLPGLINADVGEKIAAIFRATFGYPSMVLERPTIPTQADMTSAAVFVSLYIEFVLNSVVRGVWGGERMVTDRFWARWDPAEATKVQRVSFRLSICIL
eukprot:GHVU01209563.1.p1 GENE.GHVU01209563.1~~GHVU01209563.1.p1  ORF type:complete len:204 (-),score=12.34 GHVU01209563.1:467-1078(-)